MSVDALKVVAEPVRGRWDGTCRHPCGTSDRGLAGKFAIHIQDTYRRSGESLLSSRRRWAVPETQVFEVETQALPQRYVLAGQAAVAISSVPNHERGRGTHHNHSHHIGWAPSLSGNYSCSGLP